MQILRRRCWPALIVLLVSFSFQLSANETYFKNVEVFDGERKIPATNVLLKNGLIESIGNEIEPGADAVIIDGSGKFLLPGMIDCHTHTFFVPHLVQAAEFGVTTELDMMSMPGLASNFRKAQQAGEANNRADFLSAGAAVTVADGHGTQFGFAVPTLAKAEDASQFVADRIREGSDYIKIIVEDGSAYGMTLPTLSREMVEATVAAVKDNKKLAVAHVGNASNAAMVVDIGVDGLVHLFADKLADEKWIVETKEKGIFVVPTAAVVSNASGSNSTKMIIEDQHLAKVLNNQDLSGLARTFPQRPGAKGSWDNLKQNIAMLHKAGVPILAGTDAPNPGTVHGVSMHHELRLLVEAGLSPLEALKSATSSPADAFQLSDRGRIKAGLRADLVLVSGDPTVNIENVSRIEGIWKGGHSISREARIARVKDEKAAASQVKTSEVRLIDDFEGDAPNARFGSGWLESTDAMMGGDSTVKFQIVKQGANDSKGALEIAGTTSTKPSAFAGIMFGPGDAPTTPVDLSSNRSISFWAKGDGREIALLVFTEKGGFQPAIQSFKATNEWKRYNFKFTDFNGTNGKDVMGIWFGNTTPGEFKFWIDQVELD